MRQLIIVLIEMLPVWGVTAVIARTHGIVRAFVYSLMGMVAVAIVTAYIATALYQGKWLLGPTEIIHVVRCNFWPDECLELWGSDTAAAQARKQLEEKRKQAAVLQQRLAEQKRKVEEAEEMFKGLTTPGSTAVSSGTPPVRPTPQSAPVTTSSGQQTSSDGTAWVFIIIFSVIVFFIYGRGK